MYFHFKFLSTSLLNCTPLSTKSLPSSMKQCLLAVPLRLLPLARLHGPLPGSGPHDQALRGQRPQGALKALNYSCSRGSWTRPASCSGPGLTTLTWPEPFVTAHAHSDILMLDVGSNNVVSIIAIAKYVEEVSPAANTGTGGMDTAAVGTGAADAFPHQ